MSISIRAQDKSVKQLAPFTKTALGFFEAGFIPLPIHPQGKRPAEFRGFAGEGMRAFNAGDPLIFGMKGWSSHASGIPQWRVDTWLRMVNASGAMFGVGVCHADNFIGFDFDEQNLDLEQEIVDLLDELAGAVVRRKGRKGFCAYFRTSGLESVIPSHTITINGSGAIDILASGRQSVLPPSIHPDTEQPYIWLPDSLALSDVELHDLPLMTNELLANVKEICARYGDVDQQARPAQSQSVSKGVGGSVDRELNNNAMADLAGWFPALYLPRTKVSSDGGYEAVPSFRVGGTGRGVDQRKLNLKAVPDGIRDFGTGISYTPIDLVMAAQDVSFNQAWSWLHERVGEKLVPWAGTSRGRS